VRFRTPQIEAVLGAAPEALAALARIPTPGFVGGGGAALPAIVEVADDSAAARRTLVVTLVTLERVAPLLEQLREWSPTLRQVSVAHGAAIGDALASTPRTPIFLVAATKLEAHP